PRLRLDLTVNILTNYAVNERRINVFGGQQKRPNIHIEDMAAVYLRLLEAPAPAVAGKIFNAGYQNHTVMELAEKIRAVVGGANDRGCRPRPGRRVPGRLDPEPDGRYPLLQHQDDAGAAAHLAGDVRTARRRPHAVCLVACSSHHRLACAAA